MRVIRAILRYMAHLLTDKTCRIWIRTWIKVRAQHRALYYWGQIAIFLYGQVMGSDGVSLEAYFINLPWLPIFLTFQRVLAFYIHDRSHSHRAQSSGLCKKHLCYWMVHYWRADKIDIPLDLSWLFTLQNLDMWVCEPHLKQMPVPSVCLFDLGHCDNVWPFLRQLKHVCKIQCSTHMQAKRSTTYNVQCMPRSYLKATWTPISYTCYRGINHIWITQKIKSDLLLKPYAI